MDRGAISYEILGAESVSINDDERSVKLILSLQGAELHLTVPVDQLLPLVGLVAQAINRAFAHAASFPRPTLEVADVQLSGAARALSLELRLTNGIELPLVLSIEDAHALARNLAAALVR